VLGQLNETLTFDSMAAFDQLRPSIVLPLVVPLLTSSEPPNMLSNDESTMFGSFAGMFDEDGGDGWGLGGEVLLQACRCVHLCLDARPAAATAALCRCDGVRALVGLLGAPQSSTDEEHASSMAPAGAGPGSEAACMALTCLIVVAARKPRALGPAKHASDNSLGALFHCLDFYPLDTQRLALGTVAHFCRRATPDAWPLLLNAAPHLTALATAHVPCGVHVLASLQACCHALASFMRVQAPPTQSAATTAYGLSESQQGNAPRSSGDSDRIAQGGAAALAFASHGLFQVAAAWLHLAATASTSTGPPTVPPSVLQAALDVLILVIRCRSCNPEGTSVPRAASQPLALWDGVASLLSAAAASQSNTTNEATVPATEGADTCDRLLALAIELCPQPPPLPSTSSSSSSSAAAAAASVETVAAPAAESTPKKRRKVQRWVRVVRPQGITLHGFHEMACSEASSSAANSKRWKGFAAGVAPWSDRALMARLREQPHEPQHFSVEARPHRVMAEYGAVFPLLSTATDSRTGLHRHVLGHPSHLVPRPLLMAGSKDSSDDNGKYMQSSSRANGGGGGDGRQKAKALIAAVGVALEGDSLTLMWCDSNGSPVSQTTDVQEGSSENGSNSVSATEETEGRVVIAACELALKEPLESAKLALATTLADRVLQRHQHRGHFLQSSLDLPTTEAAGISKETVDPVALTARGTGEVEGGGISFGRFRSRLDGDRGLCALVGAAVRHGAPTTQLHGLGIATAVLSGSSGVNLTNIRNGGNSADQNWCPQAASIEELQRWGVFAFAADVVAKQRSVSAREAAGTAQNHRSDLHEGSIVKLARRVLKLASRSDEIDVGCDELNSMEKVTTVLAEEQSLQESCRRLTRAASIELALEVNNEPQSSHHAYLNSLTSRSSSGGASNSNGSPEEHAIDSSTSISSEIAGALDALIKAATSGRGVSAHQWVTSSAAQTLAAYLTADPSLCSDQLQVDSSGESTLKDGEVTLADAGAAALSNNGEDESAHGETFNEPASPQGVQLRGARDLAQQRRCEKKRRARALVQLRRRRVGIFLDVACCPRAGSSAGPKLGAHNDNANLEGIDISSPSPSRFGALLQLVHAAISLRVGPPEQQCPHGEVVGESSSRKALPLVLSEPCGGAPATLQRRQVNRARGGNTPRRLATPPSSSSLREATAVPPASSPTAAAQGTFSSSLAVGDAPADQTRANEGSGSAPARASSASSFGPGGVAAKVAVGLRSRLAKRLAELGAGSSRSSSRSSNSSSSSSSDRGEVKKIDELEQNSEVSCGKGDDSQTLHVMKGAEIRERNQEEVEDEDDDDDDDEEEEAKDDNAEEEDGRVGSISTDDGGNGIGPERAMEWLCKTLQVLLRVRLIVTPPLSASLRHAPPNTSTATAAGAAPHSLSNSSPRGSSTSPRASASNPFQRLLGGADSRYRAQPLAINTAAAGGTNATCRLVEEIPLEVEPLALLSTLIEHALATTLPRLRALQALRQRKIAALQQQRQQGARLRDAQATSSATEAKSDASARGSDCRFDAHGDENSKLRLTVRCGGKVILVQDCDLDAQPFISPGTSSAQCCLLPALYALTTATATSAGERADPFVSGGGGGCHSSSCEHPEDATMSSPSAPSLALWFQSHVLDLDVQFLPDKIFVHQPALSAGKLADNDKEAASFLPTTAVKAPSPSLWRLEPSTLSDWNCAWPEDELLVPTLRSSYNYGREEGTTDTSYGEGAPLLGSASPTSVLAAQCAAEAKVIGDEELKHQLLLLRLLRAAASASPIAPSSDPVKTTSRSTTLSTVASETANDTVASHEALAVASAAVGVTIDPRAQWLPRSKHAWHSHALAAKLSAQLDDPLVVACANAMEGLSGKSSSSISCSALPAWASLIVECVPFALPLDLRLKWLHATAFGPAHAARAAHAAIAARRAAEAAAAAAGQHGEDGSGGDGGHRGMGGGAGVGSNSSSESASLPPVAPKQLVIVDRADAIGALRAASMSALGTSCLPASLSVSSGNAPGVDESASSEISRAVISEEAAARATSIAAVEVSASHLDSESLQLPLQWKQGPLGGMKLEASFAGEPGSGLGPTKEFVSLLSNQLASATTVTSTATVSDNSTASSTTGSTKINRQTPLWRGQDVRNSDDSLDSYFFAPLGQQANLLPPHLAGKSVDTNQAVVRNEDDTVVKGNEKMISNSNDTNAAAASGANIVGWACMQAIQDDLLLDLPLATPLLDLLARGGAHFPLLGSRAAALRALAAIDHGMAKQLVGLLELAANHKAAVYAAKQTRDDVIMPSNTTSAVDSKCPKDISGASDSSKSNDSGDLGGESRISSTKNSSIDKSAEIVDPIEALELDWTLPGYPEISLFPHTKDNTELSDVTSASIELWVACVLFSALLGPTSTSEGERRKVNSLVAGLQFGASRVAHPACLAPFSGKELATLLTGDGDDEDEIYGRNIVPRKGLPLGNNSDAILASLECAHGYDRSSTSVRHLARALATWNAADQKQFVRFATGSPQLPRGGLRGLRPRLTVVKASGASWHHLPSAATCTHYLKLPEYPSETVLGERLRTAVQEGQGAFYLS